MEYATTRKKLSTLCPVQQIRCKRTDLVQFHSQGTPSRAQFAGTESCTAKAPGRWRETFLTVHVDKPGFNRSSAEDSFTRILLQSRLSFFFSFFGVVGGTDNTREWFSLPGELLQFRYTLEALRKGLVGLLLPYLFAADNKPELLPTPKGNSPSIGFQATPASSKLGDWQKATNSSSASAVKRNKLCVNEPNPDPPSPQWRASDRA